MSDDPEVFTGRRRAPVIFFRQKIMDLTDHVSQGAWDEECYYSSALETNFKIWSFSIDKPDYAKPMVPAELSGMSRVGR